jgi:predicted permease
LPVKDPDRLVFVLQKSATWKMPHGHSWLDYRDYREQAPGFADVLAVFLAPTHLSTPGQAPERTWIEAVSANYFSLLGVEPRLGRFFRPEEDQKIGGDPVIVIAYDYWERKFGSDPGAIGKTVILNGRPFTIIGVTPRHFHSAQWAMAPRAFVPATMLGEVRVGGAELLRARGAPMFKVLGRLKPGVTLAQARAAVEVVARKLAADYPLDHKESQVSVMFERHCRPEPTFSEFTPLLASVFLVLVGLVLLIACANVANLLFSRALAREREMGIRTAIGATRGRLIRQLLAESAVLGLLAGTVGFVVALWADRLLAGFAPTGDIPMHTDHPWDWRVALFTCLISIAAGLITGWAPALRATRLDVQTTLKEGSGALLGSRRHPFRSGLVIVQVAVSLAVLICGGIFVRSLQQVGAMDLALRTDHLLMASLDLGLQGYDDPKGRQFLERLLERVRALPGVQSASLALTVPFDYGLDIAQVAVEEKAGDPNGFSAVHCNRIEPDYLRTVGTALLRGRHFTGLDDETAPKAAIVNALMAERFWPGQDPLGKRFRWGANGDFLQVVGVARNSRYVMLGEAPRLYFYVPLAQYYVSPVTLHLRTTVAPATLAPAVRRVLQELDPHLPIYNLRTMEEHLRGSAFALMPLRMGAVLAGVQGVLGLLLAVMGLYGVVSYIVSQRTREIGIRMALGAQKLDILRLVVHEGLRLSAIGIGIGLLVALGLAQVVGRLLYGLSPANLPVFLGMVGLLTAVTLLACWLPARRAAKVDPTVALRCE